MIYSPKQIDKAGVPDVKKLERIGKDTFVIHADGGNRFEGVVKNPNRVRFKDSSKAVFQGIGVCFRNCQNKNKECTECFRFSKFVEVKEDAS